MANTKTEKRLQELVEDQKKSNDDYNTVSKHRAIPIHVKRDLTLNEREHRNVV